MKDTRKFREQLRKTLSKPFEKMVVYSQIKQFKTTLYVDYIVYSKEKVAGLNPATATNAKLTHNYKSGDRLCNYCTIKNMHHLCKTDKDTLVLSFTQLMAL
jgi:hypothetical protein